VAALSSGEGAPTPLGLAFASCHLHHHLQVKYFCQDEQAIGTAHVSAHTPDTVDIHLTPSSFIMSSRRGNLTGFDPRKFAASAGQPANDPWARAYDLMDHCSETLD
jgi:hypothetical protein